MGRSAPYVAPEEAPNPIKAMGNCRAGLPRKSVKPSRRHEQAPYPNSPLSCGTARVRFPWRLADLALLSERPRGGPLPRNAVGNAHRTQGQSVANVRRTAMTCRLSPRREWICQLSPQCGAVCRERPQCKRICQLSPQCGAVCRERPQCKWICWVSPQCGRVLPESATVQADLLEMATVRERALHCAKSRQIHLHCIQFRQIQPHCSESQQIHLH